MIEDNQIGLLVFHQRADFLRLAGPNIESRIRAAPRACDGRKNIRARGSRERVELVQLILFRGMPQSDADQERAFTAAGTFKQY
jgi:hypothetical protein